MIFVNARASNRKVIQFMREQGFGDDYTKLEQYFMQRLINGTQRVTKGAMQALVWQEVIDNNVTLPSHTVIHVWKDGVNFQNELAHVIQSLHMKHGRNDCHVHHLHWILGYELRIQDALVIALVLELHQLWHWLGQVLQRRAAGIQRDRRSEATRNNCDWNLLILCNLCCHLLYNCILDRWLVVKLACGASSSTEPA